MIIFRPYASGSSGNLYTVTDNQTIIMLECGLPWKKVQQLLNFTTSNISGILLSHYHLDHAKGVKDAARACLDVYASKQTFEALNLSGHRYIEIADKKEFKIGTWTILPFSTIHDCEGSLGFLMSNSEDENFLYLTDTMYSPVKFKNLKVIACETNFIEDILSKNISNGNLAPIVGQRTRHTHMSLETLIAMLKANDLSKCRSIHLLHLSDGNSDEVRMIREVQEQTGIPTKAT